MIGLGLPYWLVFVLMMAASFVGGFVIYRLLIRPLDGKSHFSPCGPAHRVWIGSLVIALEQRRMSPK